jgi:three-Cys-motif partner protein
MKNPFTDTSPISVAKPHTIKKFELISHYVDEWARKILGYDKSAGIIYIDCMCNCGVYYDEDGSLIDGTAILVVKALDDIISNYSGKKAILYFNDIDEAKVSKLQEVISQIAPKNLNINFNIGDANEFLKSLNIGKYSYYNTLLIYDPFNAAIDWSAVSPYLNIWGEVIINHMVSDTVRGAHVAQKDDVIAKYQETYQTSIEEIIRLGCDRKSLDQVIVNIIKNQTSNSNREHFVASFPFFNRVNGQVYNLIHCCSNIKGLILYKKVAWKTFGGKSSLKNTHGVENQLCLSLNGSESIIDTVTDDSCFYVKDIAKYIVDQFGSLGSVELQTIYDDLDRHPIFPSDGFKNEIKEELKLSYGVKFPRGKGIAEFGHGD